MMHHESEPQLSAELAPVCKALDRLGEHDRDATPPGLADRVYFRTASLLRDHDRVRTRSPFRTGLLAAACLALAGVGAIIAWSLNGPGGSRVEIAEDRSASPLDEDLDSQEQWSPIPSTALAEVQNEMNDLEAGLSAFWADSEWLDDDQESM